MYQIDNSTAAATLSASTAPGTPGYFTDGNPATGVAPTILPAEYMNMVMMEILGVLSAAGVTPSKTIFNQLITSIRAVNKQPTILTDTGVANAYAASNTPVVTVAPPTGFTQRINIANLNTGPSTYSPDGLLAKPIYGLGLQPLQGGELPVGVAVLMYLVQASVNGGSGAWIIIESLGGASQVVPATKSQHAMQLGQAIGRLIGVQTFTSSGTYTPTTGMASVVIQVQGGGGAGAGSTVPSTGNTSIGAGGSSGAYGEGKFTAASIGASQVITIGAGGSGVSGATGGNGGASSVGALISAPGGIGGPALNNATPPAANGNGTPGSAPSGANIYGSPGSNGGSLALAMGGTSALSGSGAPSLVGSGGLASSSGQNGYAAIGYGGGGGGSASIPAGAVQTGGAGKAGIIIIWEYA